MALLILQSISSSCEFNSLFFPKDEVKFLWNTLILQFFKNTKVIHEEISKILKKYTPHAYRVHFTSIFIAFLSDLGEKTH